MPKVSNKPVSKSKSKPGKFNDGQLDEAHRQIRALEQTVKVLSSSCARRLELLGSLAGFQTGTDYTGRAWVRIPEDVWKKIQDETAENEVQPY